MSGAAPDKPAPRVVTSLDVARLAGVSQSAVSRAFTPGASVSPAMAERVRAAAKQLGYRPNVLARSLITGRSRIIGVVVSYLDNYFYPQALELLSKALQEQGYHVLMFMAGHGHRHEGDDIDAVLEEILDYQVDGVVLASVSLSSDLAARCQAAGAPVVLFNRAQDDASVSAVTSDNFAGGRRAADFLAAGGHRRIGYIAGWESASTQRDRERGFRAGLAAHGLSLFCRGVGGYEFEAARLATLDMFRDRAAGDRPDALFVANDHMAFAVMDALRDAFGLETPRDVSIVGYDDVGPAAWGAYALTTIRQPADEMVAETVRILLDRIEDPTSAPQRVAVDAPLIIRKSARIPDGWPA